MNWRNYNESLVKRGKVLLDFDVIDNWHVELEKMNKDKKRGRKFVYPDSFIKVLGYMRAYFHLPYRQTEGVVRKHASHTLPSIPDYSRICRRIN
ncbi:MAG TPA: transposase, partial [Nitrososphaeraceae archaeon]|nr:transposase [Nitrososphaeraceae archaeon]